MSYLETVPQPDFSATFAAGCEGFGVLLLTWRERARDRGAKMRILAQAGWVCGPIPKDEGPSSARTDAETHLNDSLNSPF